MDAPPRDETASNVAHQRRILVVDDDDSLLEALHRALTEDEQFAVVPCASFEDAKRYLQRQTFDVLLTDIRLGAFNGLQLAVLAKDINPDTQVIVFSGFDDQVLREEAEHIGATYLVKPVAAATLLTLIRG